jgi:integral membrane protein
MIEGVSFIALLGVAMPLKYMADMPMAVRIVGSIHGLLFVAFCFVLLQTMQAKGWSLFKAAGVFLAAVLPFGPFVIDGRLRKEQEDAGSA